ncbi:site-specific DNA-methyltransferase [Clostridium niameyense]|uniref:Methyltransferase n=2 Tax=Clostridium niameyense TaxID=1622073 RepID=A0A6M0RDD4_9CLOT|nr:site-specific DNA-methyltransferase [Clostridium niameyense]
MLEVNNIYLGNCLEIMKKIDDKSVDMILCDLPYGTTACEWDTVIPFEPLWKEYKRIIKLDGVIVLFGDQPFTSELVCSNINWYSHSWIWDKNNSSNYTLAKVQPLKTTEDIIVFKRPNNNDLESFTELKNIFKKIMKQIGKSKKQIIDDLGHGLDHCFRVNSLQWGLPTEENYIKMINLYNLINVPSYSRLKNMYENEFRNRYNPQGVIAFNKTTKRGSSAKHFGNNSKLNIENMQEFTNYPRNILKFIKTKDDKGLHPAQKPVALLEYLIKTYTNSRETVLDNCMGAGSTGVACININRSFIGIEKHEQFYEIAKKRIEETYHKIKNKK